MSKINLQRGKLTVENRKSRERKRICSEVSVNSPGNPWSHCSDTDGAVTRHSDTVICGSRLKFFGHIARTDPFMGLSF